MTITDEELRRRAGDLLAAVDHETVDQRTFRGAQYDAGLAWVHFPAGKGGLGADARQQVVVDGALRDAGVPYRDLNLNPMGIGMAAPTLVAFGREDQQATHLRPTFTGEDIWCQLFSEPASGSDVAGIATRAERDGGEWVVNGQKVWTTLAHVAAHGMLLARTDPDVPKHEGLTYFVLDMRAPGVDVRPLYQMTGEAEFNEVFLTDVRVPDADRVGSEGDGWRVATTTLMHERAAIASLGGARRTAPIRRLLETWDRRRHLMPPAQRRVARARVADLWVRAEVQRLTNLRARAAARSGTTGPEGSVGKLAVAELRQAIFEACVDLEGAAGMLHEPGYPMARTTAIGGGPTSTGRFLRSRAATIEGGTSEVMRNILGQRVLGLPGDERVDRDVPWSRVPR